MPNEPLITDPLPRDSYSEFVKPFWTQVIRGKRFYRTLDSEPHPSATPARKKRLDPLAFGFSLPTINEHVDPTVFDCVATHANKNPAKTSDEPAYLPPNLFEYASRKLEENPARADAARLQAIVKKKPQHVWLSAIPAYLVMLLWATGAVAGVVEMKNLFLPQIIAPWLLPAACVAAALFAVIDFLESRVNFFLALGPTNPRRPAALDTMYWWRSFGFILFSLGALATVWRLWVLGWYAGDFLAALIQTANFILTWWLVPVAAGIGVLFANVLDRASARRHGAGVAGSILGFGSAALIALAMILLGLLGAELVAPVFGRPVMTK